MDKKHRKQLRAESNKIMFGLNSGQFDNESLQKDWNVLGGENFLFQNTIIIPIEDEENIDYQKTVLKAENNLIIKMQKTIQLY